MTNSKVHETSRPISTCSRAKTRRPRRASNDLDFAPRSRHRPATGFVLSPDTCVCARGCAGDGRFNSAARSRPRNISATQAGEAATPPVEEGPPRRPSPRHDLQVHQIGGRALDLPVEGLEGVDEAPRRIEEGSSRRSPSLSIGPRVRRIRRAGRGGATGKMALDLAQELLMPELVVLQHDAAGGRIDDNLLDAGEGVEGLFDLREQLRIPLCRG